MKSSLIFAVLVVLSLAAASTTALHAEEIKEKFSAFVSQFNKKYADADEYQLRFSAFKHNLAQIEAFRAKYGVPLPPLPSTGSSRTNVGLPSNFAAGEDAVWHYPVF
jgi:hypothetical protein